MRAAAAAAAAAAALPAGAARVNDTIKVLRKSQALRGSRRAQPQTDFPGTATGCNIRHYSAYTDVPWVPYETWNPDIGRMVGFHRELTKAMCETPAFAGVECMLPDDRAMTAPQDGNAGGYESDNMVRDKWSNIWYKVDGGESHFPGDGVQGDFYTAFIGQINAPRWAAYLYSDPIANSYSLIAVGKVSHPQNTFGQGAAVDGAGESFILINGYADNAKVTAEWPAATVIQVPDPDTQENRLLSGSGSEVVWKTLSDADDLLAKYPGQLKKIGHSDGGGGFKLQGVMADEGKVGLGFKKSNAGECAREMVNRALGTLKSNGKAKEICDRHPAVDCMYASRWGTTVGSNSPETGCKVTSYTAYTDVPWMPYENWDQEKGVMIGFHKDLVDALCATSAFAGVECYMVRDVWGNIWMQKEGSDTHYPGDGIQGDYYDAFIGLINPERWAAFIYSDVIAESYKTVAVGKKDHPASVFGAGSVGGSLPSAGTGEIFILINGYADNEKITKSFPGATIEMVADAVTQMNNLRASTGAQRKVVWKSIGDAEGELAKPENSDLKVIGHETNGNDGWNLVDLHGSMPNEAKIALGFKKSADGRCKRDMVNRALKEIASNGKGDIICGNHPLVDCAKSRWDGGQARGNIASATASNSAGSACNLASYTAYTDVPWLPYENWDSVTGKMTGFHREIVTALCETSAFSGVECFMVRDNWQNIWYQKEGSDTHFAGPGIQDEYYNAFIGQVNPERWAAFLYSDMVAQNYNMVGVAKIGHPMNTFSSGGAGETFILINGYADNEKVMAEFPQATPMNVPDAVTQMTTLFSLGATDNVCVWKSQADAEKVIEEYNVRNGYAGTANELKVIGHETNGNDGWNLNELHGSMPNEGKIAFGFKKSRRGQCARDLVNRGLNALKSSGKGKEICDGHPGITCMVDSWTSTGGSNSPTDPPVNSYSVYTDVGWPPYESWEPLTGEMKGFHFELTKLLCNTQSFSGVTCNMVRDKWSKIWYQKGDSDTHYPGDGIQEQFYDGVLMMINPERIAAYQYSNVIVDSHSMLAVGKVSHTHDENSFPADGAGETFILIDGYGDNEKIVKEFKRAVIQYVADDVHQMASLMSSTNGRTVIWMNKASAVEAVANNPAELKVIGHKSNGNDGWNLNELHGTTPNEGKVALAFKKSHVGTQHMNMVNNALKELDDSGQLTTLFAAHPALDQFTGSPGGGGGDTDTAADAEEENSSMIIAIIVGIAVLAVLCGVVFMMKKKSAAPAQPPPAGSTPYQKAPAEAPPSQPSPTQEKANSGLPTPGSQAGHPLQAHGSRTTAGPGGGVPQAGSRVARPNPAGGKGKGGKGGA